MIEVLKQALEKIAYVTAMDYEYQRWAREALAIAELESQEPVAVKRMKEWVEFLKRQSDNGQHMNIPSSFGAGTCWEIAIELEQFINTHPPQRTEPLIGCVNHDCAKCKEQQVERNFCSRCGKRTPDLITIHTCTPPKENT